MTARTGLWLYAIAERLAPARLGRLIGVGGAGVHLVDGSGLSAAVGTVSLTDFGEQSLRRNLDRLTWLADVARRHHHVIDQVARHGPVVPIRLGTVAADSRAVAGLLAARRPDVLAVLQRVRGHTEWGIKVYPARTAAARPGPAGRTRRPDRADTSERPVHRDRRDGPTQALGGDRGGPGAGAAYLRRRRDEVRAHQDAARLAARTAAEVHATLARLGTAAQIRPDHGAQLTGQPVRALLNASYLVPDGLTTRFSLAVQALADRHPGVVIEHTGPWPPYSFAAIEGPDGGSGPAAAREVAPAAAATPSGAGSRGERAVPGEAGTVRSGPVG